MFSHRHLALKLTPVLVLAALLLLLGIASAAGIGAREAPLNPLGLAYEVTTDPHGDLWVSDSVAGEVWHIHPPTGAYTVYGGLTEPGDARMDASGGVWWTDFSTHLGRILPSSGSVITWELPGANTLWGTAIDGNGVVWVSDAYSGQFYSFGPDHTVCTYTLPSGTSDYVVAGGGYVWLGDNLNGRIVRLDPARSEFASWDIGSGAVPEGLAWSPNGDLWWADYGNGSLGRLEPGLNRVTSYPLPADAGSRPEMLTTRGGQIWYTEGFSGTVGALNPGLASGTSNTQSPQTAPATPVCENLGAGTTASAAVTHGSLTWTDARYELLPTTGNGWATYKLPDAAWPWGITTNANQVYVVDQGRQALLNFTVPGTLTVMKVTNNQFGGDKVPADFNLHVKSNGSDVFGSPAVGSAAGTEYVLPPGNYVISEDALPAGYRFAGFSGGCDSNGNVTIASGQQTTCTITNDDIAPRLHLRKVVINDNGGTATVADFRLSAAGTGAAPTNLSGISPVDSPAAFKADTYTLSEIGSHRYSKSDWACTGNGTYNKTAAGIETIQLGLDQEATCTITNDDRYIQYLPMLNRP